MQNKNQNLVPYLISALSPHGSMVHKAVSLKREAKARRQVNKGVKLNKEVNE